MHTDGRELVATYPGAPCAQRHRPQLLAERPGAGAR
jgi:hypothetical protein